MVQLYTPFLTQAGAAIGKGLAARGQQQREEERNKLVQSAYMKQPGALEQLMSVDPQAAMQVKQQHTQEEQRTIEQQRYASEQATTAEDRKLEAQQKISKIAQDVRKDIASLDSYDQAKAYFDKQLAINSDLISVAGLTPDQFNISEQDFNQIKKMHAKDKDVSEVQSSKILASGLVVKVMKNGDVELYDPDKNTREKIEAAELREAELQGIRAKERGLASTSSKIVEESFKTLSATRKNIDNMNEGINLLDEGADTGAIESRFPSIKAASVKLDNLKNRLGLDVVGSVTFGALSEAELNMALDTALPTKLDAPELKKWMIEKRDAQKKLANNLEEAALFLSEPGNNVADFIKMKKKEEESKPKSEGSSGQNETPTVYNELPPANKLKVGDIVFGNRYKGGNITDHNSWEAQ